MESIQFGSRVRPVGISRSNVSDGCKGFGILLDPNPRYKNIAFSEVIRRTVTVDQEAVIKYKFNPRIIYLFLIARLNTDMKGNIIGDDFIVEFLQMSDSLYSEYTDGVAAVGKCNAIMLTKVKKTVQGRDFSYLKPQGANVQISKELVTKIKEMRGNPEFIEALWQMVDAATSISIEEFERQLSEKQGGSSTLVDGTPMSKDTTSSSVVVPTRAYPKDTSKDSTPSTPSINTPIDNSFGVNDSFDSEDDFGEEFP